MKRSLTALRSTLLLWDLNSSGSLALLASTCLCVLLTVLAFTWWLTGTHIKHEVECRNFHLFWKEEHLAALRVLMVAPLGLWLTAVASSPHIRYATGFVLWNWASALMTWFAQLSYCRSLFYRPTLPADAALSTLEAEQWVVAITIPLVVCVVIAGYDLAIARVEALQAHALRPLGIGLLRPLLRLAVLLAVCLSVPYILMTRYGLRAARLVLFGIAGAAVLLWAGASLLLYRALFRILGLARLAAATAPAWVARTAKKVHSALRAEILCLTASILSSAAAILVQLLWVLYKQGLPLLDTPYRVLGFLDMLCNGLFALLLSGALSGAVQGTGRRALLARQRWRCRAVAMRRWIRRPREERSSWEEKVDELAGRGISLSALLRFYQELPTCMTGFDASRHTTGDVVRLAVIPLTSSKRCAGAELLMDGKPTRAGKMVTHAWCNLFRDLVAAVVADAFGEGEYVFFSRLLEEDFATLQGWVEAAGVGGRTYWICAFAVNQHRAICESNAQRTDPVTGLPCPSCDCGLEKAFNSTPPLLPDGRSVPCEMNKFDDLMRSLAAADPGFSQVVPIDADFKTFTRAWCIAELAAAKELGMVQDIKIGSEPELRKHKEELRGLKIRDMQASRPEDKAAILAGIEDHDLFDASVQRLIFEDLLPTWSSLDAQERMASAGRIIRWQGTVAWSSQAWTEVFSDRLGKADAAGLQCAVVL